MTLQRAGNLEFRTIRGVLSASDVPGYDHMLIDEFRETYLLEPGRKSQRLSHLLGSRVEVKGLVEPDLTPRPKIHPIRVNPAEEFQHVM